MHIISLFNNKGGVGKTTLAFHIACILADMNQKVLMIDLDPQCNLTIYSEKTELLHSIWESENEFIEEGFESTRNRIGKKAFEDINSQPHTIHYILKPTEEGTGDLEKLPSAIKIRNNLDLIPGRLTLHMYENKISERWSGAYQGDPLSIRTITKIRKVAIDYAEQNKYDYVILDTSPSLGTLNKVIISTVDGFIIPCFPDMFSLYGIRNIGNSLTQWKKELDTIYSLISENKRNNFPDKFVQFLGYTIYNAKKYTTKSNEWELASAHYDYVVQIPNTIEKFITPSVRADIPFNTLKKPIGGRSVMYSHNTFPGMAQKYNLPMWDVPNCPNLEMPEKSSIIAARAKYEETKIDYMKFAEELTQRITMIGDNHE